ncbi:hypothetical protein, partial [uncultured Methylobacterium sp.]|uniref:hypothetical protein n=1 Tax=uncultured Methylobacterium sp. TaxID=157278 RepID=UPI0026388642
MDDGFLLFAVLAILASALSGPVALVVALRQRSRIRVLERRLAGLESGPAPVAERPGPAPEPCPP